MDTTPRNQFDDKLADRFWDIPIDIPKATHLNTPIGTRYCDQMGFICHPQTYETFHPGTYRNIQAESKLSLSLDYYNPYDVGACQQQKLSQELIKKHYDGASYCTPKMWNNHSKMHKYNRPV